MRLTGSRAYYRPSPPKMPPGLMELMEGLTKEVLRHNPSDIYGFCAGHMQQLLDKRDGPSLKKSLPLEEKIARAQEKIRLRAEKRRQEYDKNLGKHNNNATDVKEDETLIVTSPEEQVSESPSNIRDKGMPARDEVLKNIVKPPIHLDKALLDSGEKEILHDSALDVSSARVDVAEIKDKEEGQTEINHETDENKRLISKTENEDFSEKCETAEPAVSSHENMIVHQDAESAQTHHLDDISSETSKSPIITDQKNSDSLIINDVEVETNNEKFELVEPISEESSMLDCVNITTHYSEHNKVNTAEVKDAVLESINDNKVNQENSNNEKPIIESAETVVNETNSPHQTAKEDVPLLNQIKDIELSDTANSPIITKTDNNEDIQKLNNTIGEPQVLKTEEFQQQNNSEISHGLNSKKESQDKCDNHDQALNNTKKSNDITDIEKDQHLMFDDTHGPIKTPVPEIEALNDFISKSVDKDVSTLVTDNVISESNDSENDTPQVKASSENMYEVDKDNVALHLVSHKDCTKQLDKDTVDSSGNKDGTIQTTQANNEDTTQDNILNNTSEINPNEKQGTNNMDLETAAITIQKVFRNFLFKSRGSTFEDTANYEGNFLDEDDKNKEECDFSIANAINIDTRPHGITRMDTVLQTVNEEKSLSLSTDDSSTLSSAATIIQAHVRRFLVRNKLNSNKTASSNSLAASNSNEPSLNSVEAGNYQNKNKTVLNIHIVPEGENYLSRDESLVTSMDLSLDSSPPSSINLHPLGYDKTERRKQLKREDAIQSISPPSNNSGKLSEDLDSVKELSINDHVTEHLLDDNNTAVGKLDEEKVKNIPTENGSLGTDLKRNESVDSNENNTNESQYLKIKRKSLTKMSSDEMDVVTPFMSNEDLTSSSIIHSGEFHDAVLPTRVSRSDTSVVSGE